AQDDGELRITVALIDASLPYLEFMDDASLAAAVTNSSKHSAYADENGEYRISHIAPGTYLAIAVAGERVQKKKDIRLAGEDQLKLNFDIRAGVRVFGRITRADGSTVADHKITLGRNIWSGDLSVTTDNHG